MGEFSGLKPDGSRRWRRGRRGDGLNEQWLKEQREANEVKINQAVVPLVTTIRPLPPPDLHDRADEVEELLRKKLKKGHETI